MNALARALNLRRATIIDLERNRPECVNRHLVGRIAAWFHAQGIPCEVTDLLELVEPETLEGQGAPPDAPGDA